MLTLFNTMAYHKIKVSFDFVLTEAVYSPLAYRLFSAKIIFVPVGDQRRVKITSA